MKSWRSLHSTDYTTLKPGDVVKLSGGGVDLIYTVQNLTISAVDEPVNTIGGTADTGAVVQVSVWGYDAKMS